jgi:shikimate 5-dehydrogenase
MITLQQFFEVTNYRITEGDSYGWSCYGPNAHQLSAWNGIHGEGGWSANIVFSTKTQKVYEVTVCDYTNDRAYRIINPKKIEKYRKEATERDSLADQAWDDVDYIDLDVDEDFLEKAQAIVNDKPYDTRVQMQVTFSDEEMLTYMKMAHELDITFNELVERALTEAIKERSV